MGKKHGDLFTYRNYINGEWVVPDNASIDKHAISVRAPVGVIGIITPWNFPIAIAAW
ncbi:Aldehyde Dehydrogenase [Caldalkalibacillus thermarum TA2.A1]|uniref:Aldehyde Dehydrogenase n=1 Tax=Caldalkalibacillus thermarum (strain TA2.A1) TaxID=986075 RepID=F5L7X0_CALTT|nr:Aldehyde Dehydrogenase [Caldalkalibacillus thermarum TA2.A1]